MRAQRCMPLGVGTYVGGLSRSQELFTWGWAGGECKIGVSSNRGLRASDCLARAQRGGLQQLDPTGPLYRYLGASFVLARQPRLACHLHLVLWRSSLTCRQLRMMARGQPRQGGHAPAAARALCACAAACEAKRAAASRRDGLQAEGCRNSIPHQLSAASLGPGSPQQHSWLLCWRTARHGAQSARLLMQSPGSVCWVACAWTG